MATLSVRENVAFSAALRLPTSVSGSERTQKVETVISDLGLSHVAHIRVCAIYTHFLKICTELFTYVDMHMHKHKEILYMCVQTAHTQT